jgi:multisubunit Na+/H+ antiporter MnhC subunit
MLQIYKPLLDFCSQWEFNILVIKKINYCVLKRTLCWVIIAFDLYKNGIKLYTLMNVYMKCICKNNSWSY